MKEKEIDLTTTLNNLNFLHKHLCMYDIHSIIGDIMPLLIQTVKELINTKQQVQELQKALNERK
jgi:hypothetical protein